MTGRLFKGAADLPVGATVARIEGIKIESY